MTAPLWLRGLLGWRAATAKSASRCQRLFGEAIAPNIADVGTEESLRIAGSIYEQLAIPRDQRQDDIPEQLTLSQGTLLERGIEDDVFRALREGAPERPWRVTRNTDASKYAQFRHLAELRNLLEQNQNLRTALGRDYHIKTDVLVGVDHPDLERPPFLHAAVSCKWTIRSDRVQNVRHEFATLVRHRRGRLPHLVLVTAEPLPGRLISIARGTGEIDAVYHLLYNELDEAIATCGTTHIQQDDWAEMVGQGRVKPYSELATDLTLT